MSILGLNFVAHNSCITSFYTGPNNKISKNSTVGCKYSSLVSGSPAYKSQSGNWLSCLRSSYVFINTLHK